VQATCTVQCKQREANCVLRSDGAGSAAAVHSQQGRAWKHAERSVVSRDETCRSHIGYRGAAVDEAAQSRKHGASDCWQRLRGDVLNLATGERHRECPASAAVVPPRSPRQIHSDTAICESVLLHCEPKAGKDGSGSSPPTADTRCTTGSAHAPCARRVGWAVRLPPPRQPQRMRRAVHGHSRTYHTRHSMRHITRPEPPASKHTPYAAPCPLHIDDALVVCTAAQLAAAVHNHSKIGSQSVESR
jgi:hypothetical protein